jgi:hypothetical protein
LVRVHDGPLGVRTQEAAGKKKRPPVLDGRFGI